MIQDLKLTFDDIMHVTDDGVEYWSARELCKVLGYNEFNKFMPVIRKSMIACENSGFSTFNHFAEVSEMITTGKGAQRKFNNYHRNFRYITQSTLIANYKIIPESIGD